MMLARSATLRLATSAMAGQSRCLSSQTTVALAKLRSVLEDYRVKNYTQETRTRFKKEVVRAATLPNGSNLIGAEGLQRLLQNIGYSNQLTQQEIENMINEVGDSSCAISAERMAQLI